MENFLKLLKKSFDYAIDSVFIPSALEKMTAEEFSLKAPPCEEHPEAVFALFDYKDKLVKQAIWELKFRGNRNIAKLFAELLHEELLAQASEYTHFSKSKPILVPLPSHPNRIKEKGFNQMDLIANQLAFISCGCFEVQKNVLYKIKDTPAQFSIKDRTSRLNNLKDAFAVKDISAIKDKVIFLIDDVVTTGSTLKEARKALKKSGAKKIHCFALAHG